MDNMDNKLYNYNLNSNNSDDSEQILDELDEDISNNEDESWPDADMSKKINNDQLDNNKNQYQQDEDEFESIFEMKIKTKTNSSKMNANTLKLSLKYLFQILKMHKLDHYLLDLVEHGYSSAILVNSMKQTDLDKMNISPYDKKKFIKLKLFIKQILNALKTKLKPLQQSELNEIEFNRFISQNHINLNVQMNEINNFKQTARVVREPVWQEVNNQVQVGRQVNLAVCQPSVCHPKTNRPIVRKTSSPGLLFGPKLSQNQTESDKVQCVEARNYNYGVPLLEQQSNHINMRKSKSFIRKIYHQVNFSGNNSNKLANSNTSSSSVAKAGIFVFARKRPKLPCEAKFNDVVDVNLYENSDTKINSRSNSSTYICVNEIKSAVDGTSFLRKVKFQF
jgi:hypothetical protein